MKASQINLCAVSAIIVAEAYFVALPLGRLLHYIVTAPRVPFVADANTVYIPDRFSIPELFAPFLGVSLCILGLGLALTTTFGSIVTSAQRLTFAAVFWFIPAICFLLGSIGRYLSVGFVHQDAGFGLSSFGNRFYDQFLRSAPWLYAVIVAAAPLVFRGRGIYLSARDLFTWFLDHDFPTSRNA